jgi:hypothetical protein
MSTQIQTVEITLFGRKHRIHSLEEYPICPCELPKEGSIWVDTPDGNSYIWDEYGNATIISRLGTYRFFRKKPTIADAVYNLCEYTDSCFSFLKGGCVEHRLDTRWYWWGPSYTGEPIKGGIPYRNEDDDNKDDEDDNRYENCYDICEVCNAKSCYNIDCMYPDGCDRCQSKNCSGGCGYDY